MTPIGEKSRKIPDKNPQGRRLGVSPGNKSGPGVWRSYVRCVSGLSLFYGYSADPAPSQMLFSRLSLRRRPLAEETQAVKGCWAIALRDEGGWLPVTKDLR